MWDMRRENAFQSVGYGLLAHLSRKKSRCALTKCLSERRIRIAYAHVGKSRHVILNKAAPLLSSWTEPQAEWRIWDNNPIMSSWTRNVILNEVKDLKKENECIRFFAAAQNDRRDKPQEGIRIRDPHVRPRILPHDDPRCRPGVAIPISQNIWQQ